MRTRGRPIRGRGAVGHGLRVWLACLCLAGPAVAQAPPPRPPGESPEIVVRGESERALRAFVVAMAERGPTRQLGRWYQDICPRVIGIDPAQAAAIEARIGAVAGSLELRPRTAGCPTTMLVVVSAEAPALAASFARRYPVTLGSEGRWRLERFVASTLPVRWLSVTDPCGAGGCAMPNSRLALATRPAFQAMIVIVDAARIGGFGLGELSDYLAVVLLGSPPLEGNRPATSVLSMFERPRDGGARFALTGEDRAFLQALYRSRASATGQQQRDAIARRLRRDAAQGRRD